MKGFIDTYSFQARTLPLVLFCLPAAILMVVLSFEFDKYSSLFTSLLVVGGLNYFFVQLSRDAGKLKEKALWQEWGGTPSIQLLRWRNAVINKYTKRRYHDKLQAICPAGVTPDQTFESNDPNEADEVYSHWCKHLLANTRDTTAFNLLFKENMNYGYRRNLWGLKPYAISLLLVLMVGVYFYFFATTHSFNPNLYPIEFYISEMTLVVALTVWVFRVNKNFIKTPAFAYAERLLEATEKL
jgi:hypothetical protein